MTDPTRPELGDLPNNSNAKPEAKHERPKQESVVEGRVLKRKKGFGAKFAETFTAEDTQSVGNYVISDILLPAAKNTILDAVSQGLERLMFGDRRTTRPSRSNSYTSYSSYYTGRDRGSSDRGLSSERDRSRAARAQNNYEDLVLESRGEAEDILDRLQDLIQDYDSATVGDFYDLAGVNHDFPSDRWGWYSLKGSEIKRVREGWLMCLPKPVVID